MAFAKVLVKLRKKAKLTTYGLAREAWVDYGYLWRLEKGERHKPSRDLVLRLAQTLLDNSGAISFPKDVDRLLRAAGYGPLPRNRVSIRPYER